MNTIISAVKTFVDDEDGITAIEYGLMAAVMAAALTAGMGVITGGLRTLFDNIAASLTA